MIVRSIHRVVWKIHRTPIALLFAMLAIDPEMTITEFARTRGAKGRDEP